MAGKERYGINYSLDIAILCGYHIAMIQVNISTLKNQLSAYLRKVKKGEEVLIMDRDRPVAKISTVSHTEHLGDDEALLNELERRGVIRRATKPLPSREWFEKHMIKLPPGVSAVQALLDEREESPY